MLLCSAYGIDMEAAGEAELGRVWTEDLTRSASNRRPSGRCRPCRTTSTPTRPRPFAPSATRCSIYLNNSNKRPSPPPLSRRRLAHKPHGVGLSPLQPTSIMGSGRWDPQPDQPSPADPGAPLSNHARSGLKRPPPPGPRRSRRGPHTEDPRSDVLTCSLQNRKPHLHPRCAAIAASYGPCFPTASRPPRTDPHFPSTRSSATRLMLRSVPALYALRHRRLRSRLGHKFLKHNVRDGDHVVVVGGGEGVTAVVASKLAVSGHVTCFEGSAQQIERVKLDPPTQQRRTLPRHSSGRRRREHRRLRGRQRPFRHARCRNAPLRCPALLPAKAPSCKSCPASPSSRAPSWSKPMEFHGAPTAEVRALLAHMGYQVEDLGWAEPDRLADCRAGDIRVLEARLAA